MKQSKAKTKQEGRDGENPCKMRMNIDFFIHWSMTGPC